MKCLFPNNHVVVVINDKNYLVDLGSPVSFSYAPEREIEVEGRRFSLMSPMAPKEMVDRLTGIDIQGLIGMDVMKGTNLTINREEGTVTFGIEKEDGAPYIKINSKGILGVPYVAAENVTVNGSETDAVILDTGAWMPYVHPEHLREEDNTGIKFHDENPQAGDIAGTLYNVTIGAEAEVGSVEIRLQAGEMPWIFAGNGFDAIINPMSFSDRYIAFDFEKDVMYFGDR